VLFKETGETVTAKPGAPIADLADNAGCDIQYGCNTGSCGVCEVELRQYDSTDGTMEGGSGVVVRACVAVVPRGWQRIEIDSEMADDIWGYSQDGFDT